MSTPVYPPPNQDFEDAQRGLLRVMRPCIIYSDADPNTVIWDNDAFDFIQEDVPPKLANTSLWRQGQLCQIQGLFRVTDGVYQVRGLDISNMTMVETPNNGVIIIDTLTSVECARAALGLYREQFPDRTIAALIYTHSHADHFGGARAVVEAAGRDLPVYAPDTFLEHAVSENVYAGNAMGRRAVYMYGESLPKSPAGQINCGLGMTLSSGTPGLSAPTVVITANSTVTIDGVEVRFQLTPNTEAPAEMNMYFPQYRALCMAENAVHTMHNIQTLRGALVRDALAWSKYVDQTIVLFGQEAEVVFASHHWPTWGQAELNTFLAKQRDLYAYLHNETLRQMNDGRTGMEIAEDFVLPTALQQTWSCRGYYGSVSHNVKAIYHRYMGWFDGNPAHLWEHPPVEAAKRYVDSVGGMEQMIALGQQYSDAGDLRFAATLLGHAVFADQDNRRAREALGAVYTQLGYAAENGTWRGFYLTGARELENASQPSQIAGDIATLLAMSLEQLFDSVAVRIDGPRAWDERFTIDWMVREMGVPTETHGWHLNLSNGALTGHRMAYVAPGTGGTSATLTVWLRHVQLAELIVGERKALEGLETRGDVGVWDRLQALITTADGSFAIVTPEKLVAGGSQQ